MISKKSAFNHQLFVSLFKCYIISVKHTHIMKVVLNTTDDDSYLSENYDLSRNGF